MQKVVIFDDEIHSWGTAPEKPDCCSEKRCSGMDRSEPLHEGEEGVPITEQTAETSLMELPKPSLNS